jgi:hypothetical protein
MEVKVWRNWLSPEPQERVPTCPILYWSRLMIFLLTTPFRESFKSDACMLYTSIFMLPYGRHGFQLPARSSEMCWTERFVKRHASLTLSVGSDENKYETGLLASWRQDVWKVNVYRKGRNEIGYRTYPSHCLFSLLGHHDITPCRATARQRPQKKNS